MTRRAGKQEGLPFDPVPLLAAELAIAAKAVAAVLALMAEGATVPFVARYRKEATGGLDETQIRAIVERRDYLAALDERRRAVTAEIDKQGKLSADLRQRLLGCQTKAELEDLYAPFRPKRRTRATMARERGLEPLADRLWNQPREGSPRAAAAPFVDPSKGVPDVEAALAGARDICAERIADDAAIRRGVRDAYRAHGLVVVRKAKKHRAERTKFDDYDGHREPAAKMASHRLLAIRRGEAEGVLRTSIELRGDDSVDRIERRLGIDQRSPWGAELRLAVTDAYQRLLGPRAQAELQAERLDAAEREAVEVFAKNLRQLLLAAPFGPRPVLGVDPGQRTGCKCAAVDSTGRLCAHDTIYLVSGPAALERARATLLRLVEQHRAQAVAVGNGTHGRETAAFVRDSLRNADVEQVLCVSVNEAGASVYSASAIGRQELGEVDLTVRGAVSIARRLQDPLAELVKIDPKSIGVGQYQHDVHQPLLAAKLAEVVESCVNAVGVELNTASAALLAQVAGLGPALASKIVEHRQAHGVFRARSELLRVSGLGPKTYQQAAGFLRVRGGAHPLDASAVHPERYPLVERMAADAGVPVGALVGDAAAIGRIRDKRDRYVEGDVGRYTVDDILAELSKPGRDPRQSFAPPRFRDDVRTLEDLAAGMVLEGVVTNVTAFGAFVDVGVHQDGLVHVSQLADRFVRAPSDVVAVGDRLQVRVLDVDRERRRISLSAKPGVTKP